MALTIEEQHETNDLDHDILATREVTFICGHKRVYEDISACQKSWMERCQRCPNCQYKRDKAYVEKLSAEINSPELLEMWLKEPLLLRPAGKEAKAWFDEHRDDEGAIVFEGSEEIADEELYVNDRNDEHCGLSLSGSASERL